MAKDPKKIKCDIAIIGGGAGGLSVAAGGAQLGAKVVLIESGKMGGDCLNTGCVPSKSLLAAAKAQWQAKHGAHFGIDAESVSTNFKAVMRHVHQVIDNIAKHDSVERFEKLGVRVIQGRAKFLDQTTIQAADYTVQAKRFVIATGSSAFVPPTAGLDAVPYLTNESIFELSELPQHLIVIGGGPIGVELAQAFAMLGSQVTILEGFKVLPKDEPDCVAIVKEQLQATGITLYEGIKVNAVEKKSAQISVTCEQDNKTLTVSGTHLLVEQLAGALIYKAWTWKKPVLRLPQKGLWWIIGFAPAIKKFLPSVMLSARFNLPMWRATMPELLLKTSYFVYRLK